MNLHGAGGDTLASRSSRHLSSVRSAVGGYDKKKQASTKAERRGGRAERCTTRTERSGRCRNGACGTADVFYSFPKRAHPQGAPQRIRAPLFRATRSPLQKSAYGRRAPAPARPDWRDPIAPAGSPETRSARVPSCLSPPSKQQLIPVGDPTGPRAPSCARAPSPPPSPSLCPPRRAFHKNSRHDTISDAAHPSRWPTRPLRVPQQSPAAGFASRPAQPRPPPHVM